MQLSDATPATIRTARVAAFGLGLGLVFVLGSARGWGQQSAPTVPTSSARISGEAGVAGARPPHPATMTVKRESATRLLRKALIKADRDGDLGV